MWIRLLPVVFGSQLVHEKITELRWEDAKGLGVPTQRRVGITCRRHS